MNPFLETVAVRADWPPPGCRLTALALVKEWYLAGPPPLCRSMPGGRAAPPGWRWSGRWWRKCGCAGCKKKVSTYSIIFDSCTEVSREASGVRYFFNKI